MINADLMI